MILTDYTTEETVCSPTAKYTWMLEFIPVNKIASTIRQDVLLCLLTCLTCYISDTRSPLFKIGKRIAYNMLVVNIGYLLSLAEVGQSSGVTNGLDTANKYMLLLYGVKINSSQSLNQLRYNYASKSDKSVSLFPPTDGTFQQYTIKYQVALWIHSLEAKLGVWNPDGNGWQLRDNKLKHVMCKKMRPRNKFEISNISIASMKTVHRVEPVSA